MRTIDELEKCNTVPQIAKLIGRLKPSIGTLGGRYYSSHRGESIPLKKVIQKLEKCYKKEKNQAETLCCIWRIKKLEKNSLQALKQKNFFIRLLTIIRQLLGNTYYPKHRILKEIQREVREKLHKKDFEFPCPSLPSARSASLPQLPTLTHAPLIPARRLKEETLRTNTSSASSAAASVSAVRQTPATIAYKQAVTPASHSTCIHSQAPRPLPVPPLPLDKLQNPPTPPKTSPTHPIPAPPPPPRNIHTSPRDAAVVKNPDLKDELLMMSKHLHHQTPEEKALQEAAKEKDSQTVVSILEGAIQARRKSIDGDNDCLLAPQKNSDGWTLDPEMKIVDVSTLCQVEFGEVDEFTETLLEFISDKFGKILPEIGPASRIKLSSGFLEIEEKDKAEIRKVRIISGPPSLGKGDDNAELG